MTLEPLKIKLHLAADAKVITETEITINTRYFRLPPRTRRELPSSGLLSREQC